MIRMMVSPEEAANDPTVERVDNFHGHETGRVNHASDCPHANKHDLSGAKSPECGNYCFVLGPLFMKTSHVGLVLSLREMNGYDDSDFYAKVWNPEKGEPEEICYASTRGWTYPNGANVDATPEVRAAFAAWDIKRAEAARAAHAAREARVPYKGKTVRVIRGRKVPLGTVGEVVWFGDDRYYRGKYGWPHDALALTESGAYRIGLMVDGKRVFTNAANVEVITSEVS